MVDLVDRLRDGGGLIGMGENRHHHCPGCDPKEQARRFHRKFPGKTLAVPGPVSNPQLRGTHAPLAKHGRFEV
jgi:hypothetical protein